MYKVESNFYSVPSLDKSPASYDNQVAELSDFYKKIAQEELREDDSTREKSLQQMRDWIAKNPNIRKCRTDTPFLLRYLRSKKYCINTATETLEKYLAGRVLHPDWFKNLDVQDPELGALVDSGYLFPLLERDSQGRTLIFNDTAQLDPTKYTAAHVTRIHLLTNEALYDMPEVQCAGVVMVYDLSGMSLAQLSLVSLNEIRILAGYLNNGTPMRIREFHFVNTPSATLTIVNFALQLLSEKLRERVFCHKNFDELYTKVDRNLLPKEFGGKSPKAEYIAAFKQHCLKLRDKLNNSDLMDIEISKDSKYWQESHSAELESGAIGSFRQLVVD
ncbi:clavesin-2-like [Wyeomyia smithii]|uniref:clavesin-2-like n=1 Tax=Wyeomyia smithii TaxID=174621 RepID=UPI002467BAAC|nr:clavesin-2-like [Wyeomyia smithii]